MNEEVYDYLMELNRLTRVIGCTEEQRKGVKSLEETDYK